MTTECDLHSVPAYLSLTEVNDKYALTLSVIYTQWPAYLSLTTPKRVQMIKSVEAYVHMCH